MDLSKWLLWKVIINEWTSDLRDLASPTPLRVMATMVIVSWGESPDFLSGGRRMNEVAEAFWNNENLRDSTHYVEITRDEEVGLDE